MTDSAIAPGAAEADAGDAAPAALAPTRPFYWSVRRELWENRSIYLAPPAVAVFAVVGLTVHGVTMPSHVPGMLGTDPAARGSALITFTVAAILMLVTGFVVGAFYCLEALSGERRDRSILFWKSLPVSDLTTVLAKATIPLLVLPAVTFAALVAMHVAMLLLSALVLLVQGHGAAPLWNEVRPFRMWPALLYATAARALWHAPVYAFLLLVSGWARRTAALWAVLPLLALVILEYVAMGTQRVAGFVVYRLSGWSGEAFAAPPRPGLPLSPLAPLTPGRFLATPDLWLGLLFAAACLFAAVRLRRLRDPA